MAFENELINWIIAILIAISNGYLHNIKNAIKKNSKKIIELENKLENHIQKIMRG